MLVKLIFRSSQNGHSYYEKYKIHYDWINLNLKKSP